MATLSIKLLINSKTNKLCFAEASSDVVEFLTALLSLPLGTITSLLAKENMAGSVGTLLRSTEKLCAMYNSRERNLIPAVARPTLFRLQMLLGVQMNVDGELYVCAGKDRPYPSLTNCGYLSTNRGSACPSCGGLMNISRTLAGSETNRHTVAAPAPSSHQDTHAHVHGHGRPIRHTGLYVRDHLARVVWCQGPQRASGEYS
jgi:hypothetical protein